MKWTGTKDDLTAVPSSPWMLRVEQMDTDLWWWAVYWYDERVDGMEQSKEHAMSKAESIYKRQKNGGNIYPL